jgi:cytochrome c oxidase subunit 1
MASTATVAAPHAHAAAPHNETGLWSWITTVDHKRIGILYFFTSIFFFMVGGAEALFIRTQLIVPNNNFISADTYNQMFTQHALTMIFLALMPLTAAFFNYIVPLQIGARDVAFPRLNALSYWVYFFAGVFLFVAAVTKTAPNVGWFAYAPITERQYNPGINVDFYVLGLQIAGLSSILAGINFIVTILNMRAPGMRLMRMPIFTWMVLITQVLIVTAMAVFTIAITQLMFDRMFGTAFFDTSRGGDPLVWQHLFWMFGHPEVYILIIPIFGMISEVIPTFSRKPLFGYNVMVFASVLIGWLGWGVWSHHMFATGLGPIADAFFALSTMLIAIPTGIKIFNWIGTMWGGSLRFTTSMLFAVAFIAMFTVGGISGVMHSVAPSDLQQTDTYFVVAHIHYVFFGGTALGLFSGIYFWFPKLFGRLMDEKLGKIHWLGTLLGMNLSFFPMHFLGMYGQPRRTFTYPDDLGWGPMNLLSTLGAYLLGAATVVFVWNVIWSARKGAIAGANPWGASTLEWSIPSPPPVYNFREIPVVHSRMPLWEADPTKEPGIPHGKMAEDVNSVTVGGTKLGEVEYPDSESKMSAHDLGIHLPPPSYWPIVLAFGILLTFGSLIFRNIDGVWNNLWWLSVAGVLTVTVSIFKWAFEPGH